MRDRYLRFRHAVRGHSLIASYVDRIDFDHDAVFGAHDDQLALVGAAHIAFEQDLAARSRSPSFPRTGAGALPVRCSHAPLCMRGIAAYRGSSCIFSRKIRRSCV